MTIIEQIKAYIERRLKKYATDVTMPLEALGKVILELKGILSFLSTIEESEKPMIFDEELNEEIKKEMVKLPFFIRGKDQIAYARHFAQWGAEHLANSNDEIVINGHKVAYDKDKDAITMEAIPNDLEKAAISRMRDPDMYLSEAVIDEIGDALLKMAEFGAKWQKEQTEKRWLEDRDGCFWDGVEEGKKAMREQMMQEAVEGEFTKDNRGNNVVRAGVFNKDFEYGDKVRVIIVSNQK